MALSVDLISEFAKVTTEETKKSKPMSTLYGTIVEYNGKKYVRFDGSDLLTPISSTTDISDGERVTVTVKNHTATVTGNITAPSAKVTEVEKIGSKITEVEILVADKVSTKELEAERGRIDELVADNVTIKKTLTANSADIGDLQADTVTVSEKLAANEAEIEKLSTNKLDANVADLKFATIDSLEATNADIYNLDAVFGKFETLTTDKLTAVDANIKDLDTKKLSATDAEIKYANIDFSNIGKAAMEYIYAESGLIKDVTIQNGTITGELIGVTIKGNVIEGGTIVADKLVIKGEDGLYYKLNTDGVTTEAEQTDYNSLNGGIITAHTITAEKISVTDLVAFDATIGGFNITTDAIYSGVKESAGNTTRGVFLGNDGQVAFGDADNFVKFYKDDDGTYKLSISAASMVFSGSGRDIESIINDQGDKIVSIGGDVSALTSYISITTYDGKPCMELGNNGKFKIRITNTDVQFIEGSSVPARITNNILEIKKAEIENELSIGDFIFVRRPNGNVGIMWGGM